MASAIVPPSDLCHSISLACQTVDSREATEISEKLTTKPIKSLALRECSISTDNLQCILSATSDCPWLVQLSLKYCDLNDLGSANLIADTLRCSRSIATLDLSGNRLGQASLQVIADAILSQPFTTKNLNLSDCHLDDQCLDCVAKLLQSEKGSVRELDLSSNSGISSLAWEKFTFFVATSADLSAIRLTDNNIGDSAGKMLALGTAINKKLAVVTIDAKKTSNLVAEMFQYAASKFSTKLQCSVLSGTVQRPSSGNGGNGTSSREDDDKSLSSGGSHQDSAGAPHSANQSARGVGFLALVTGEKMAVHGQGVAHRNVLTSVPAPPQPASATLSPQAQQTVIIERVRHARSTSHPTKDGVSVRCTLNEQERRLRLVSLSAASNLLATAAVPRWTNVAATCCDVPTSPPAYELGAVLAGLAAHAVARFGADGGPRLPLERAAAAQTTTVVGASQTTEKGAAGVPDGVAATPGSSANFAVDSATPSSAAAKKYPAAARRVSMNAVTDRAPTQQTGGQPQAASAADANDALSEKETNAEDLPSLTISSKTVTNGTDPARAPWRVSSIIGRVMDDAAAREFASRFLEDMLAAYASGRLESQTSSAFASASSRRRPRDLVIGSRPADRCACSAASGCRSCRCCSSASVARRVRDEADTLASSSEPGCAIANGCGISEAEPDNFDLDDNLRSREGTAAGGPSLDTAADDDPTCGDETRSRIAQRMSCAYRHAAAAAYDTCHVPRSALQRRFTNLPRLFTTSSPPVEKETWSELQNELTYCDGSEAVYPQDHMCNAWRAHRCCWSRYF